MARKAGTKKQKAVSETAAEKGTSFFDYLRFGESYTSLILGIIVVIIATALLLSFVQNKNTGNVNQPISQQTQNTVKISQKPLILAKKTQSGDIDGTITTAPTSTIAPTRTSAKPTVKPTTKPTVKPTNKPQPTVVAMKSSTSNTPSKNPTPTAIPQVITGKDNNVWVVHKGESLWRIAEQKYASGYNWVDIAKANHLANPGDIHVGDRLILPSVTPKASTIAVSKQNNNITAGNLTTNVQQNTSKNMNKITGKSYTVVKGDSLWNIAVRAYGDGYKWTTIAGANNLSNPGMIFSGNHLKIPRG